MKLSIQPITFDEACAFIERHHRHHEPPTGWLFGCAVNDGERVVGVITVGRPVPRMLQDGWTVEATRNCTDGTPHAASKLYAAAWRAARALGYRRLVTYLLESEPGTSVKAVQFRFVHMTAGGSWDCPSRPRMDRHPTGPKQLWLIGELLPGMVEREPTTPLAQELAAETADWVRELVDCG